METLDIFRNIWFILIGVLFAGYCILDGFDLGVGIILPFAAKDDRQKKILIDSIWPVWDGNEVWLLTGAGALFAAFPLAYGAVFSGFYILLMLILFALIFRAVSMEFWYYDESRRKIWAGCFAVGSFIAPLLFGIIAGNLLTGVPLNDKFQFTGSITDVFRPLPVITGILALLSMIVHGALYASIKTDGELQDKTGNIAEKMWVLFLAVFIISAAAVIFLIPGSSSKVLFWISAALIILAMIYLKISIKNKKYITSFIVNSLIFLLIWIGAGSLLYPDLLKGAGGNSITIYNASSSLLTLKIMFIIAVCGVPVVIAYSIFVYWVFRGKVKG